jgi:exodeoxyribonuclease VII large subunit
LPTFPKRIAVITSTTGAVIHDILHRISARFPTEVIVFNAIVQGNEAAASIVAILSKLDNMQEKPEVVIIARGGGSIEDLWCFNDEELVRAIAACKIPIVSAIGHETDFTLADFAADLRAPTPTAAAELVVPVLSEIKYNINNSYSRIKNFIGHCLENKKNIIQKYFYILNEVKYSFEAKMVLINTLDQQIKNSTINYISKKFNEISLLKQKIEKYNKENILKMGFAVIKDQETKKIITSGAVLRKSRAATVEMHDSITDVIVKQ